MVKQYLGVDIIEISRVEESVARWGNGFLDRVFTQVEKELYKGKIESLAVRFAAKEAVVKALGCREMIYRDVEILSESDGRPSLKLHGRALTIAGILGITEFAVSLSHDRRNAVAIVSAIV